MGQDTTPHPPPFAGVTPSWDGELNEPIVVPARAPLRPLRAAALYFAATERCRCCGAGMAIPIDPAPRPVWTCSAVLLGTSGSDDRVPRHSTFAANAFAVIAEFDVRAEGQTTRPDEPYGERLEHDHLVKRQKTEVLRAQLRRLEQEEIPRLLVAIADAATAERFALEAANAARLASRAKAATPDFVPVPPVDALELVRSEPA